MSEEERRLQRIFLGQESESDTCWVVATDGAPIDPLWAHVTLADEGVLVIAEDRFTKVLDDLATWDGSGMFLGGSFAFVGPSGFLQRKGAYADPDHPVTVAIQDEAGRSVSIALAQEGADVWVPLSEEDTESLSAAIREALAEFGYADRSMIVEHLEQHDHPLVDVDTVSEILCHPDFPAMYIPHGWFHSGDSPEGEFSELQGDVLELLGQHEPARIDEIVAALEAMGWVIDQEDVYDVLYDPTLPTYKLSEAWYLTEQD